MKQRAVGKGALVVTWGRRTEESGDGFQHGVGKIYTFLLRFQLIGFFRDASTLVSGKSGDFPLSKAVGGECDEALPTPMPLHTLGQMPRHRCLFPQWAFRYGDRGKIQTPPDLVVKI